MNLLLAFLNNRVFLNRRFRPARRTTTRPGRAGDIEGGQASVEYALVLLGAGIVASLVIGWAGKTGSIGELFDSMINLVKGKAQ